MVLKVSQLLSALSISCQATGFNHDCRLLIFKAITELRNEMVIMQVKT